MSPTPSSSLEDKVDDKTVEAFIYGNTSWTRTHSHRYSPDEFLEIPSNEQLPSGIEWRKEGLFHGQESYSSFGDKGTTASVNAYGSILQISRYLGVGTSGIFCVDPVLNEPRYLRHRMEDFLDSSTDHEEGFGLCFNSQITNSKPRLQFLHNRWPRYTHEIGSLSVSIQYFANRGAVIQQYLFQPAKVEANKDAEEPDASISRGTDNSVSQDVYEDVASEDQTDTHSAQDNGIQDGQKQNHQSSGERAQDDKAEQNQTQERLPTQDEGQSGETRSDTYRNVSVRDCLRFEAQLQICESEWVTDNKFNSDDLEEDARYQIALGANQYSLVVRHQRLAADEAVGLVIGVFVNGHATKLAETQDEDGDKTYEIQLDSEEVRKFDERQESEIDTTLEITVVYDLRIMATDRSWESTLIPASVLDLNDLKAQNSYDPTLSLSKSAHFNFIMMRHLEHILSVCSIPIPTTPVREDDSDEGGVFEQPIGESLAEDEKSRGNPIALTCGDISGHPVLISASFFAFKFLFAIYSYLQEETQIRPWTRPFTKLVERIFETVKGHLEWVFLCVEKDPDDSGQFRAEYWANGKRITSLQVQRTPQPTALQIIKARDFASEFQGSDNFPSWFLKKVGSFVEKWIDSLREIDKRDSFTFPRVSKWGFEDGYYLSDHVLIWKALGIAEELEDLRMDVEGANWEAEYGKRVDTLGIYTSEEARRMVLRRFTTLNAMTNDRMFAVRRETQHNSFLLDSLDTVLFYDEGEFFNSCSEAHSDHRRDGGSKAFLDEWTRTMNVQPRHEGTDDKDWQQPLQYALSIQMANHKHQINSRPASDMLDEGLKVLLQSCSSSGVLPGFLSRVSKLSSIYDYTIELGRPARDLYWHTSFEVPYILWLYAKGRLEEVNAQDRKQGPLDKHAAAIQRKTDKQTQPQMGQSNSDQKLMPKLLPAKTVLDGLDFADQKNVFEISDEWLAYCPDFLHFKPEVSFDRIGLKNTSESNSAVKPHRFVMDIPKATHALNIRWTFRACVDPQPHNNKELFDRLLQWRTKDSHALIKKRIIWLSSDDQEAVEICLAAVPESERLALTNFFGKHDNREKCFLDDLFGSANSWKTEFQLSFYELGKEEQHSQSQPEIALAKRIRQGSMGFRFNGDFFDCYWTCHVISTRNRQGKRKGDNENDPEHQDAASNGSIWNVQTLLNNCLSKTVEDYTLEITGFDSPKLAWHQRKVLELILFEEIIREVTAGTQEILKEIREVLTSKLQFGHHGKDTLDDLPDKVKETVIFSKINGNAYFSLSAQWEVLQQLLHVLDESLSDTVKKVHSWQIREENRGKETPRWTTKDERRYRPTLRRMQISNVESVRELQRLQESVQTLRSSLISRRDYIRDDLSLRGAEHTRYFTYVTVVFLPLGFATGIFSMNAKPAGPLLAKMSGTAAVTLFLTVVALYSVVNRLEAINKLRTASAKSLAKVKGEVERLLLPLFFALILWSVLRGSIGNFFKGQKFPSPLGSTNRDTDRRDPTASLPHGGPQSQPSRQRRPTSVPGDLENQIHSHRSSN